MARTAPVYECRKNRYYTGGAGSFKGGAGSFRSTRQGTVGKASNQEGNVVLWQETVAY